MNKNISTFIACDNEYKDSKVVLFGAPFDGTTSFRPGTRFASSVVRNESYGLETYSPYLDLDMEDVNIFDGGDLEFCFGNAKKVLDEISSYTSKVLNDNKVPFMIGGEHLVTLGTFREVAKKYEDVHIIHLDAHTDLREDYMGEELSHASVIRRCYDIVGSGKIFQFGIRSGMKEEFLFGREHCSLKSDFEGIDEVINNLKDKPVYITIDLDILDPSIFPGTGTPEPGGITFKELQEVFSKFRGLNNIVGCDIVELAPNYDHSGASTAVCAKAIRELLLVASN